MPCPQCHSRSATRAANQDEQLQSNPRSCILYMLWTFCLGVCISLQSCLVTMPPWSHSGCGFGQKSNERSTHGCTPFEPLWHISSLNVGVHKQGGPPPHFEDLYRTKPHRHGRKLKSWACCPVIHDEVMTYACQTWLMSHEPRSACWCSMGRIKGQQTSTNGTGLNGCSPALFMLLVDLGS